MWLGFVADDMELERVEMILAELAGEKIEITDWTLKGIIEQMNLINTQKNGIIVSNWRNMSPDDIFI